MPDERLSLNMITPEQAARVLTAARGQRVTEDHVRAVAEHGKLLRADGTMNLIEYAAHLAGETWRGGDRSSEA